MLALADALDPDVDVAMLVPQDDVAIHRRVTDRGHAPLEAAGDTPARVAAVAASPFDVALQRRLRDRAPLSVVDDLGLMTDCDLAVNPAPGGEALRPDGAGAFLGGAAYALIRASVVEARELAARRGRQPRTVLVSTGATDPTGLGRS